MSLLIALPSQRIQTVTGISTFFSPSNLGITSRKRKECLDARFFTLHKLYHMYVSKNRGTPKSSILIGFFNYKPSILGGFPTIFGKHPYIFIQENDVDLSFVRGYPSADYFMLASPSFVRH